MACNSIEDIARLCHQRNKIFCEAYGDYSQVDWEDAPQWQKESAIEGVIHVIKNFPKVDPSSSHENWFNQKMKEGWQYGPVKDAEQKIHPCMLPWSMLPAFQRIKDIIFVNTVLNEMGLKGAAYYERTNS